MIMDSAKIAEAVNTLIGVRNTCRQAIAANEQVIPVPAVPATEGNPGKPASQRSTGQLPNANNNLFVAVNNLIGHLRNIAPNADVSALVKALNAPLVPDPKPAPAKPATPAAAPKA
jgi:hypothetical protein